MSVNRPKSSSSTPTATLSKEAEGRPAGASAKPPILVPSPVGPVAPLFRSVDWLTFGITTLIVFLAYWWTLAPDMTLEDSGELAVASKYAGVPHPPGYPVWTIYTWFFTKLPFSNIAYRVGLSSAVAGALACGLVGMMVSRGSSMIMEGIAELKGIARKWENSICAAAGFVAALLTGFNGFMWSQSVIVEVYTLSVLSLAGVLVCLMRWIYAPHQMRYLYLAFFWFGICFNNHQSLLVTAIGLEVAILATQPKLGRDLFFWNSIIYVGGLIGLKMNMISVLNDNVPLLVIYNLIGIGSLITWMYLVFKTRKRGVELLRDLALIGTLGYLLLLFGHITSYVTAFEFRKGLFIFINLLGLGITGAFVYLVLLTRGYTKEWIAALLSGGAWTLGAAFYVYMPIASMSNPPLNWGYPRIVSGFIHAFTRGQYEKIHPTTSAWTFVKQIVMYIGGAIEEFNLVYLLLAIVPILFYKRMQKRERSWLVGIGAIYICLSFFLLILLNPAPDRQSRDLNKVFFTASHVMIAMGIGYGLTLIVASLLTQYDRFRNWVIIGGGIAAAVGLYNFVDAAFNFANPLVHYTALFSLLLPLAITGLLFFSRAQAPFRPLLTLIVLMPIWSVMAHWEENEQRGHFFGYWFGHDMFTPPFNSDKDGKPIYPEMTRDAVLFGGTDPGRFNPTYMIFCESFIPPSKKPRDPKFDRRDVYLITQNALADGTYLNYIRAHYNRSTQNDPGFFTELLRGSTEMAANTHTNFIARLMVPVDNFFLDLGDRIEKARRAGTSYFKAEDFIDLPGFLAKLRPGPQQDLLSKHLFEKLSKETQNLITQNGSDPDIRKGLAKDFNERVFDNELAERRKLEDEVNVIHNSTREAAEKEKLIQQRIDQYRASQHQLYHPDRFKHVSLSDRTTKFIKQNPNSHTLIRLDRILLEEAYPKLLATSIGGVYPDREINTPTPEDSQRCFHEYLNDAQRRLQLGQLKPQEDVRIVDNKVSVSGQVAVMAINGLLTKVIFDNNPDHEFFVEESFPLDWMYPYLTPHGIIMRINRQPLPELTEEAIAKDHEFWSKYSTRLIGNWIAYDTPVSNICAFVEKVYNRRDYRGFKGAPEFIRDNDGQKAFSKLRSSISGLYAWRVQKSFGEMQQALSQNNTAEYQRKALEYQRMLKEAEFAFKQAYAFCPYSPEAIFRYINLLVSLPGRVDDAILIAKTSVKLDPNNVQMRHLIDELNRIKEGQATQPAPAQAATPQLEAEIARLEQHVNGNPNDLQALGQLAGAYAQGQRLDKATALVDRILTSPTADMSGLLFAAQIANQLNQLPKVEQALTKVTQLHPTNPEVWYDLGIVQALLQKEKDSIASLQQALERSAKRLAENPNAPNLHSNVMVEPRLNAIRQSPDFQRLIAQPPTANAKG